MGEEWNNSLKLEPTTEAGRAESCIVLPLTRLLVATVITLVLAPRNDDIRVTASWVSRHKGCGMVAYRAWASGFWKWCQDIKIRGSTRHPTTTPPTIFYLPVTDIFHSACPRHGVECGYTKIQFRGASWLACRTTAIVIAALEIAKQLVFHPGVT